MIKDPSTLVAGAAKYESALTDFLRDLVRILSVNGRDPEAPLAASVQEEARKLGFDSRLVALQPQRPNVLVTYGEGADGFALTAHLDTVSEGNLASWSCPPFAAEIMDGRISGRGAADNKAGIACGLYTLALLRDLNLIDPTRQKAIVAGFVVPSRLNQLLC